MTALLTGDEMLEAVDDVTSPYYLDDGDRYAVLRSQAVGGWALDEAMALAHRYQHYVRAERGVLLLTARTERGEWRWTR